MWDLPGPGLESVSPALAGGFLTTVPPGKSNVTILFQILFPIRLLQNIEQSSLCYTAGPCRLFIFKHSSVYTSIPSIYELE